MANQSANPTYKPGDVIGQKYEVRSVLGSGGFGDVYLVCDQESGLLIAIKTLHKEFLADEKTRKLFQKESNTVVEFEPHPYVVWTYLVEEISGLLFILMEYITPDEEGINTLSGYLRSRSLSLIQTLRWAIQICYGMEYIYSKGIKAHRDIKPDNIMITSDGMPKISDFGLAGMFEAALMESAKLAQPIEKFGKTQKGAGFGTPSHMPPEQFYNAAGCDQRSDIYSFGIVLFQMVTGGQIPIPTQDNWQDWLRAHSEAPVPKLNSPLYSVILRCLEKIPDKRYQSFSMLRLELEILLRQQNGESVSKPQISDLDVRELSNKGVSLNNLGRYEEAIRCIDKALKIDPFYANTWIIKGNSLNHLGRYEEAIYCYDMALEINSRDAYAWNNKGTIFSILGKHEEAIRCISESLEINPLYLMAWYNKGIAFSNVGRYEEAIRCYEKALEIDSQYANVWNNKGDILDSLGRYEESICCYDKALEIDPRAVNAWLNKGVSLANLGHYKEAMFCYDKVLEINAHDTYAWNNKGLILAKLQLYEEALRCYDEALKIDPHYLKALRNRSWCLNLLNI